MKAMWKSLVAAVAVAMSFGSVAEAGAVQRRVARAARCKAARLRAGVRRVGRWFRPNGGVFDPGGWGLTKRAGLSGDGGNTRLTHGRPAGLYDSSGDDTFAPSPRGARIIDNDGPGLAAAGAGVLGDGLGSDGLASPAEGARIIDDGDAGLKVGLYDSPGDDTFVTGVAHPHDKGVLAGTH